MVESRFWRTMIGFFSGNELDSKMHPGKAVCNSRSNIEALSELRTDRSDLAALLRSYSDPAKFNRLPIIIKAGICDCVVSLLKQASDTSEFSEGSQFVSRFGLPHHLDFLRSTTAPDPFRSWYDYSRFALRQRTWQIRSYRASLALHHASSIAIGTADLARLIAEQIECEVPAASVFGPVHTTERGSVPRAPAFESALSFGTESRGLVALRGIGPVTKKDVLKIANDCLDAAKLYHEFRWIQALLVLPRGRDIRSADVIHSALSHQVVITTTVLPTQPLGLSRRPIDS